MTHGAYRRWHPSPFLLASAGIHAAAAAAALASHDFRYAALAAVILNHAALTAASLTPRSSLLGPNTTRLPETAARRGSVALTFDDGPDPKVTPAVLDVLASAGQTATFFCVGKRAQAFPELVAAIRAHGHGVENHTYNHPNGFAFLGPRGMLREIGAAQRAIDQAGGGVPALFRAPAGMMNPWLGAVLSRANLSLVSWTRRGFDTVSRDPSRIADRLVRKLRAGDILVLHDGACTRTERGRPVVLEALPRVLDAMTQRGFRSESLESVRSLDGSA